MKKFLSILATAIIGVGAAAMLPGAALSQASAAEETSAAAQTPEAIKCTDNSIFKVAEFRPVRDVEQYRLTKYDVISVTSVEFPNGFGTNSIQVGIDGRAQLPYVGGVKLVGLTLDEAGQLVENKMKKYIKVHDVIVYLVSYGARKVYVMGNVKNPGQKDMSVDNMNVYAAISNAGGVDEKGRSKHIQVIRQLDGRLYYKEVNMDAFVKKHDMSQNLALEDGDIIYVPDSGKIIFSQDVAPYINIWATYRSIVKD